MHQSAAIRRVRLARARVASQAIDKAPKSHISITFHFKSKVLKAPSGILRVEVAFRMAGTEERDEAGGGAAKCVGDQKTAPVVLVECAYEVDYVLREGFEITPGHVKAFKDGNAIFNVWAYFREYLQNNLQRMGFPPLTAPFLRLQPKPTRTRRTKDNPR